MTTTLERYRTAVRSDDWNREILVDRMTANIARRRAQADAKTVALGEDWYAEGLRMASEVGDGDIVLGAAVIAILSPRRQWRDNVALAYAWSRGEVVRTMGDQLRKLARIGSEDLDAIVGGPKVRSFWANLSGDSNAVTVDVWALRAALASDDVTDDDYGKLTSGDRYAMVAEAYRRVARRYREAPSTTQAVVWIVERGSAE